VILAVPPPQATPLLRPLDEPRLAGIIALFDLLRYVPTLCVAVQLPRHGEAPFDLCLPELPSFVNLIAHDSSKRPDAALRTVVIQARPGWSRQHLDGDPEVWSAALLAEAAEHWPQLADTPVAKRTHRWRFARPAGPGLRGPLLVRLDGGARLGFTSDAMDPAGGLEGAWRAGRRLAELTLMLETSP
jgi:predicted NAD/FAD-dependent oxidoreductase